MTEFQFPNLLDLKSKAIVIGRSLDLICRCVRHSMAIQGYRLIVSGQEIGITTNKVVFPDLLLHKKLSHHPTVFMLQDVTMKHVWNSVVCKVLKFRDYSNGLSRFDQNRIL